MLTLINKLPGKFYLIYLIEKLDNIGFKVICCDSDCGGGNVGLWKSLNISFKQPVFKIPNGKSIVYMPNALYILNLVRNWLLDSGFSINDIIINKNHLRALVTFMSAELSVFHKLSMEHVTYEESQIQKVKLASQLLSHTTATAAL